jgi:ADP-ribosylglycohydrolase/Homeodomain-like domain
LATCESIIENAGLHVERLASHFAKWFAAGRISGIGASTLKSMRDLVAGVHRALAGNQGEYSAGNGAAMRIAPLAFLLDPSSRQTKRLWKRYRREGAKGLQHRSAGRSSNRAKPEEFRRKVLQLIRKKYSGTKQERFGPTLAAEHLADEDGLDVGEETLRRWLKGRAEF